MVQGSTDFTKSVVAKALDGHWQRHAAISGNLANVETPGYKKHNVEFENHLSKAVQRQHGRLNGGGEPSTVANNDDDLPLFASKVGHFSPTPSITGLDDVEPRLIVDDNISTREDANGVDVETEMVTLAENTQRYVALQNMAGRLGRSLKGVIRDSAQV
ncbi:MAG: flagellar basal body rod protein FlgB [Vampirovibrionales bacterium]|nr:flagellar basal body rod protein FlgB [Vampirovibrionales bacterium]